MCLMYASADAQAKNLGAFDTPMTFALAGSGGNCNGCEWISAIGVIEEDTPAKFQKFISEFSYRPAIYLHSPGGNLMAGLELGRLIRANGFDTVISNTIPVDDLETSVPGVCASACAYAFFGGVNRQLERDSRLGFHQFYRQASTVEASGDDTVEKLGISPDQFISGLLIAYAVEMGVDARILTVASTTGSNEIATLSEEELEALNVVTRKGFGDWWMEPFGDGLVVAARALDSYSSERQITIYCRSIDRKPIAMLSLQRYMGYHPTQEQFRSMMFDASVSVGEAKAYVPKSSVEYVTASEFDIVRVPIDPGLVQLFDAGESIRVEVSGPHILYNFGVRADATLTPQARKMIRIALRNCV